MDPVTIIWFEAVIQAILLFLSPFALAYLKKRAETMATKQDIETIVKTTAQTAFANGYGGEKGKNFATKEDMPILLIQALETDRGKAAIAHALWKEQAKVTTKKEGYIELLRKLAQLNCVIMDITDCIESLGIDLDRRKQGIEAGPKNAEKYRLLKIQYETCKREFEIQGLIASMFMSEAVLNELQNLVLSSNSLISYATNISCHLQTKEEMQKKRISVYGNLDAVIQAISNDCGLEWLTRGSTFLKPPSES